VFGNLRRVFDGILNDDKDSAGVKKLLGEVDVKTLLDGVEEMYDRRDVVCHNDAHCFNLLVESKPSISTLEQFGPTGGVKIVDWEMCHLGPYGRDFGQVSERASNEL